MKKNKKILISILLVLIVSLAVGCSNDAEEDTTEDDDGQSVADVEKEEDTEVYDETQKNSNYFIESHLFDHDIRFYTAFSINRDEDEEQALSPEDRLEMSLLNSDPSEQDILSSYTDLSLEQPILSIQFNEEGNQLSTTTAQSTLFYDSLFGISDFYGVEEIIFLNPEGEKNITVAERLVDDSIVIKDERGLTRGYYTIYDDELEETFFLPGGELEEQVVNENDDPLSFPETVEAMGTIDYEDAFYSSAIVEGIKIVDASITKGVASVQYTMDEDKVTEEDRTVFENAIQLAALDFHAWEVELMNDTLKESNIYPLVEDIEKEDEQVDDAEEDIENDDLLKRYSAEEIEYARIWLQMKDNMDINELKVIYIGKGEAVNPYDKESVNYPEDVIMLSGVGVAGSPGVVYSGNGDGTINFYDTPSHWQDGIEPEGKTMREYTEDIVKNSEEIYIEPRSDKKIEELIQKINIED